MTAIAEKINQNHVIRQIAKPTLVLDDMEVLDTEYGTSNEIGKDNESPVKYTKAVAADMPLVMINEKLYKAKEIVSMRIVSNDFLPSLDLTLIITEKVVYSTSFPKDGDLVSVFIRSKDDVLKPIRNDYYIVSVSVESSNNETGYDYMHISGVLYVPGLQSQTCQSNKGKSIEVLQDLSQEMGIGFATNESVTTDEQTWISPYERKVDYIKDITKSAWKNEDSFFQSFIDIFYHLNFVNVDPMFSEEAGLETGIDIASFSGDIDDFTEMLKNPENILLTNSSSAKYSKFRITSYEQRNFANAINFHTGYVKFMHYYDSLLKEKVMFMSDPKTTPGAEENMYIMKGRNSADQRDVYTSHDWMGTIYGANGENCHSHYLYAKSWNKQNLLHLEKLYLEVNLEGVNMNLRRFQVIPVLIVIEQDQARKKVNSSPNADEEGATADDTNYNDNLDMIAIDKFYSGFYVLNAIEYIYEQGYLKQRIQLMRREWPVPPNNKKA